jgi:GNAT superfamily N-acetyltransferase
MSDGSAQTAGTGDYAPVSANDVDADRLINFASRVWPDRPPYDRILSCWWRNAPSECAHALVHRASGLMVGLCAGRPSEWIIAGRVHPAVSICDFFVDPRHEGRLLGRRLLRSFEAPGRLLNAISISDVAATYVSRMGWKGPYDSALMLMPLPGIARVAHSLMRRRSGLDLTDHVLHGAQMPDKLGADLDRIEAARVCDAPSRMRRGASEWSWRMSIYPDRTYRFCIAYRDAEPLGYVAVRSMTPGRSRQMGKLRGALITDLAAFRDDPAILRALAARAVAIAAELRAAVALFVTTAWSHRRALASIGFVSPSFPLLRHVLARHAPTYMWQPRGPGAALSAENMTMTFADSAFDLDL